MKLSCVFMYDLRVLICLQFWIVICIRTYDDEIFPGTSCRAVSRRVDL